MQKAVASFKDAVLIMEKQKPQMIFELFRVFPLYDYQALFEFLIELSVKGGDARGAWEWSEKAKARSMVDLLAGQNIAKTAAEAELIEEYEAGQEKIATDYRKLFATDGSFAVFGKNLGQIVKKENEQKEILHRIKTQNEELYALTFGQWPSLSEIHQLLDINTTLFCYYASEKTLYVWAISRERVHLEKIAMSREAVDQLVLDFRQTLAGKDKERTADIRTRLGGCPDRCAPRTALRCWKVPGRPSAPPNCGRAC